MKKKKTEEEILNEAAKRFKQILEYTYMGSNSLLSEEGDEDDDNNNTPQPPAGGPNNNAPASGPDGNNAPAGPDNNPMPGGNPPAGPDNNNPNGQPQQGGDNNAPMPNFDNQGTTPEMGGDDDIEDVDAGDGDEDTEYVDVEELTDSQKDIEDTIQGMNDNIQSLVNMIDTMVSRMDQNNMDINSLRDELEKRNPTDTERMNLRLKDGQPFNVKPEDYWKNDVKHPNYEVYSNNDENLADEISNAENEKEYVIRKGDIDGNLDNIYDIAKSLDSNNGKRSLSDFLQI